MTDVRARWRFPWGLVVTLALVAGGAAIWRWWMSAPWDVVLSAALTVGAAFLAMRWLQNGFWGVVIAVLLTAHPLYRQWSGTFPPALWAESLQLVMLAVAISAWRLSYRPDFAWGEWLILFAVVAAVTLGVRDLKPDFGLVYPNLSLGLAFPVGTVIAGQRRRQGGDDLPHRGNLFCCLAPAFLVVILVKCWYPLAGTGLDDYMLALRPTSTPEPAFAFDREQMEKWAWPHVWAVCALMGWGWWCSLLRGWREFHSRRSPTPWLLALYGAGAMIGMTGILSFTSVAVLLTVFGVADLIRGVGERLILRPPTER